MNYKEYKKDLQKIHDSEIYGLALFKTAAAVTINPEKKAKWLVLAELEKKTLNRYLDYMKKSNQPIQSTGISGLKGNIEGFVLGLLPWKLAMKLTDDGTIPFQKSFSRLVENASENEKEFFDYVLAHEISIQSFAKKELANEADSLAGAKKLING
jgi:hypothetical protein